MAQTRAEMAMELVTEIQDRRAAVDTWTDAEAVAGWDEYHGYLSEIDGLWRAVEILDPDTYERESRAMY